MSVDRISRGSWGNRAEVSMLIWCDVDIIHAVAQVGEVPYISKHHSSLAFELSIKLWDSKTGFFFVQNSIWSTVSVLNIATHRSCSIYVSASYSISVLILLYMCPHTTIYVSSYCYKYDFILLYASSYYYMCLDTTICVLILLCRCPHTTKKYVPSDLILLYAQCPLHI